MPEYIHCMYSGIGSSEHSGHWIVHRRAPGADPHEVMKVLLVRHAQSANNIVQARVHVKITSGVSSEQQAQNEWL